MSTKAKVAIFAGAAVVASFIFIARELIKLNSVDETAKRKYIFKKVDELQDTAKHLAKHGLYDEAQEYLVEAKRLLGMV